MIVRVMWIIAGIVFVILWRDRLLLAALVLIVPGAWLKEALLKAALKEGAKR